MGEVPAQTRYNLPIEILYTVVPLVIVAVLFCYTARDEAEITKLADDPDNTVNVVGFQWSWTFNYVNDEHLRRRHARTSPPTLWLPGQRDDPVRPHLARRHPLVLGARRSCSRWTSSRAAPTSSS